MNLSLKIQERSNGACELCSESSNELKAYAVPPRPADDDANIVAVCTTCNDYLCSADYSNANYWRFLTGSIWSETPAVQALSYKILNKLKQEDWAGETIESVFLEESVINWANEEDALEAAKVIHKDAYGVVLQSGDTVILTDNLNVKGANFIASKGTVIRKIKLVPDNAEQIEGKIEGDTIVILTKYIRKSTV